MLEHCWLHVRNDDWLRLRQGPIKHGLENRTAHSQESFVGLDNLLE